MSVFCGIRRQQSGEGGDVVQFFSNTFYSSEKENAVIQVVRIGSLYGKCSVQWKTEDNSAQDGKKYRGAAGTLEFGHGECVRSFEIQLIDDDDFDSTLDFYVVLSEGMNCIIDSSGSRSVVMITDDDMFPSNKHEEQIKEGSEDELYGVGWSLLFSFMGFCFTHVPEIRWKTCLCLLLSMLGNAYYLSTIFLRVYLVDTVLDNITPGTAEKLWFPGDRNSTSVAVGLAWILPNFILLGADYFEMAVLEMGFYIRYHLRVNLFRKYLNYTEQSRQLVPLQDLKISMMEDIPELVSQGYLIIFELWSMLGKIVCIAYFMLRKHPHSAIPLFAYPILIFIYVQCTYTRRLSLMAKEGEGQSDTTGAIMHLHTAQRLVNYYNANGYVVSQFENILRRQRSLTMDLKSFEFWNSQLIPWITLLAIGNYMAMSSRVVLSGNTSLGSFLATINVYKDLGDRFTTILRGFTSLSKSISPLCGLTLQFSYQVDVLDRSETFQRRERFALDWLQTRASTGVSPDDIPIVFEDVQVAYSPCMNVATGGFSVQAPQGTIIQIAGPHDSGKRTMLSLICDGLPPSTGVVLVSPHLNLLHVPHLPLFGDSMGVFFNLHMISDESQYSPEIYARGVHILQKLRLDKRWIKDMYDAEAQALHKASESSHDAAPHHTLWCYEEGEEEEEEEEEEEVDLPWTSKLSTSEKWRFQLARALLHNPHVLAIHRPVQELEGEVRQAVLSALQDFVQMRGLDIEGGLDRFRRRPRTVIFTTGSNDRFEIADYVWRITPGSGVIVEKCPSRGGRP
ncbi:Abcb9 [Symbiodinium microadriaticum]|nr:Abcb9 [Symbiodinium microadriaticum]